MFKQMGINKIVESINNKMINGELIIDEKELIDLINEYTDNKFNIDLSTRYSSDYTREYIGIELKIRKK